MEQLNEKKLQNLTFPDADVTSFELDLENRVLRCSTDSSHLGNDENRTVGITKLTIKNWKIITVQEWKGDKFVSLIDRLDGAELKDIGENSFGIKTSLKGFTRCTDFWTEYIFYEAEISVEIDSKKLEY